MATRKSRPARRQRPQPSPKVSPIVRWSTELGPLRLGLLLLALLVVVLAPEPGAPAILDGGKLLSTLIAPALAPILFMVLMLDALMGRVLLGSARGAERARYRRIVATNLVAGIFLFLWWTPYFARLFQS